MDLVTRPASRPRRSCGALHAAVLVLLLTVPACRGDGTATAAAGPAAVPATAATAAGQAGAQAPDAAGPAQVLRRAVLLADQHRFAAVCGLTAPGARGDRCAPPPADPPRCSSGCVPDGTAQPVDVRVQRTGDTAVVSYALRVPGLPDQPARARLVLQQARWLLLDPVLEPDACVTASRTPLACPSGPARGPGPAATAGG